jgi:hypothetical protein
MLSGVQRVWGSSPSHSQVNSHCGSWSPEWTPKISKSNLRDQNSMGCGILYIIGKLLERKYLKCSCIAHLDIWNASYGQKKGRESNCQFDFRPEKVRNRPKILGYRGRATYHWKALNESYNVALDCISIGGLLAKLLCPKIARVLTCAILGLSLGSPETKSHLDVGFVASHRVYYKGEGGGFP